ncbi:MAG TPA: SWIM zinc finger family protein [Euzebya sp.]|nr:SWIM zinc finger family protein [Euzebya sp.]
MRTQGGVQWTEQRVHDLAPDAAAIRAARALARPGPWSQTGGTDTVLWGRCQGSGATPYQVTVDLTGPTVTCSCPSRKLPCTHGLALLLLWMANDGAIEQVTDPPEGILSPPRPAAARKSNPAAPPDPAAQAKRLARRLQLMGDGLAEFERWLGDLVRDGLAAARRQPYAFWDTAAARLVDAQVPALAERVRDLPGALARREDWADHLLAEVGRWYLATQAWAGRDGLDADDQADLRTYLGWARQAEEVLAGQRVRDRWLVLGVHRTDSGRLIEQRTWLQGLDGGHVGLVLDFAGAGAVLEVAQVVGSVIEAELARYPGHPPARLRFTAPPVVQGRSTGISGATTLAGNLARAAAQAADNPFADRFGVILDRARVHTIGMDVDGSNGRGHSAAGGGSMIIDADGDALPAVDADAWHTLAVTGGHEVTLFGELERGRIRPLSAVIDDRVVAL